MEQIIGFIKQPWPWYVAGPMIAVAYAAVMFFGKRLGLSSAIRHTCAASGLGKINSFFDYDWKAMSWNLFLVLGIFMGGFVAMQLLTDHSGVGIGPEAVASLEALGLENPGQAYLPSEIFSWEAFFSLKGFSIMVLGGFLIGFGARYADGCTSGHAISGLSEMKLTSLIAIIGFFVGGTIGANFLLPLLLNL